MNDNIVNEKIDRLIDLAEETGDVNTQIILLVLRGAKNAQQDGILAKHLQKFAQDVLLPAVKAVQNAPEN